MYIKDKSILYQAKHLCKAIRFFEHLETTLQQDHHTHHIINEKLCYFKAKSGHKEKSFADELKTSLQQNPKFIAPKFFYDYRGSKLFEQICNLPEYYLTRTEIEILSNIGNELAGFLDGGFRLVELGSGASIKTRHILDILKSRQSNLEYVPIDISEFLEHSTAALIDDYPDLSIVGVIDTYENGLKFLKNYDDSNNLIAFFGSSFGNLSLQEGKLFLDTIYDSMKPHDLFLIGLDLIKDESILKNAYDDSSGITAKFNLNVLHRINQELGADFNLDNFAHHVRYNTDKQRIEMYLRSLSEQCVSIPKANLFLDFKKGDLIHTENSHKYALPQIHTLMLQTGFKIQRSWQDSDARFALILLSKD